MGTKSRPFWPHFALKILLSVVDRGSSGSRVMYQLQKRSMAYGAKRVECDPGHTLRLPWPMSTKPSKRPGLSTTQLPKIAEHNCVLCCAAAFTDLYSLIPSYPTLKSRTKSPLLYLPHLAPGQREDRRGHEPPRLPRHVPEIGPAHKGKGLDQVEEHQMEGEHPAMRRKGRRAQGGRERSRVGTKWRLKHPK